MKKAENSEKHPEIWKRVFSCMKNQDGASLMAALLFFVFCGVGASIILASASASAGKIRHLPGEDQKRYAVDSAAAFLRDELQKTENIVKIKEVIVEDSREDDIEDNFYCYYVGSQKNMDNEASWQKFYATDAGTTGTVGAILDSLIVDIYKNNEYGKQTERDDASEEEMRTGGSNRGLNGSLGGISRTSDADTVYKEFTLTVKKSGTSGNAIAPLKTNVRLWMADNYKITAVISDTLTAEDKKEERCERRLELEALTSTQSWEDIVSGNEGDPDDSGETGLAAAGTEDGDSGGEGDSYTITTTTIITTIRWQNGTIEKELLQDDK